MQVFRSGESKLLRYPWTLQASTLRTNLGVVKVREGVNTVPTESSAAALSRGRRRSRSESSQPSPVVDEPLAYALVDLILTLAKSTEALIADVMEELDLTRPQADVLWQLDPLQAAPAMRALASKLRCDPSTVTFLADRMEARGLLVRQVNPSNRRMKLLHLTSSGRSARSRLVEAMTSRSPLAKLSSLEQRGLRDLLDRAVVAPLTAPDCYDSPS